MPFWTEPCRVHKFRNEAKTALQVRSIWHKNLTRDVNLGDVLKIPKTIGHETLEAAKVELFADLTQHRPVRLNMEEAKLPIETLQGQTNLPITHKRRSHRVGDDTNMDVDTGYNTPFDRAYNQDSKRSRVGFTAVWEISATEDNLVSKDSLRR